MAFFIVLFVVLVLGALVGTFSIMARASKAYGRRTKRSMDEMSRPCSTCKSWMLFVGVEQFRVRFNADGWQMLFGDFEKVRGGIPLEVYSCPTCRKVEFALPPAAQIGQAGEAEVGASAAPEAQVPPAG